MIRICSGLFQAVSLLAFSVSLLAQTGSGFAVIGIASGQSAHINGLNEAIADSAKPGSCSVTFQFLDSSGKVLKQASVNLQPGTSDGLDLSFDEISLPATSLRAQVRAVLLFGYSGGANPPPQILQQSMCGNLTPSLEVYDNVTQRTSLILTSAKPLPQPATPAQ